MTTDGRSAGSHHHGSGDDSVAASFPPAVVLRRGRRFAEHLGVYAYGPGGRTAPDRAVGS
jgi:hypothetical protein